MSILMKNARVEGFRADVICVWQKGVANVKPAKVNLNGCTNIPIPAPVPSHAHKQNYYRVVMRANEVRC